MQEEIEHKTVNLAISTTKLSARTLLRGMQFLLRQYDKHASQGKRIANRIFTFILKGWCYYADSDSPYFSAQPAQDPYQPFFLMGGGAEWKLFSKQSPIGSSHC